MLVSVTYNAHIDTAQVPLSVKVVNQSLNALTKPGYLRYVSGAEHQTFNFIEALLLILDS
jgi:hypothetical protein